MVRFGGLHEPIAQDGTASLLFQGMVLNGRFIDAAFDGHVVTMSGPAGTVRPLRTCVYAIRGTVLESALKASHAIRATMRRSMVSMTKASLTSGSCS
jgi:hypothetical protein